MSADLLRQAATILRERAEAATAGPWTYKTFPNGFAPLIIASDMAVAETYDKPHLSDAAYIATVHPGVGLALADWLDDIAAGWVWDEHPDDGWPLTLDESMDRHAATVARLIVGGAS